MRNIYVRCDNLYYLYSLPFPFIFNNFLHKNDNKNYININEEFWFLIINKLSHLQKSNNINYHTLDELDKNKNNEVLDFLKAKVPQIFKDGKLDLDAFKLVANLSNQDEDLNEKYGLNWKGKTNSIWKANQKSNKTLIPQRDKSMNFDESNNIIIEGDNLDVLKTLQASYANKVDVIYIDPPYNTGNDFIYNDDFNQSSNEYKVENNLVDEDGLKTTTNQKTDGRFHTNWLNMMYPRLMLARKLLKEDGVIFISIDDNEQAHLKMICDEIFGEHNFVSCITWIKKHGPGGNTSFNFKIVNNTEYILVYAKSFDKLNFNIIVHDEKALKKLGYVNKDKYYNERGYYKLTHLFHPSSTGSFQYLESLDYPIKAPDGTEFKLHVNKGGLKKGRYTWGYEAYLKGNELGFIECKKNEVGDWVAFRKQYQFVKFDPKKKVILKMTAGQPYENIIDDFYSQFGGSEIIDLFGNKNLFDFPKPINLIKHILKMTTNKESLIFDFFAGSGTTGQAVMELNKEDDGNRKFVLIQLPQLIQNEDNILAFDSCFKKQNEEYFISNITRERIKRSIEKYGYKEKGFKFFKLDESNIKSTNLTNQNSHREFQQSLLDLSEKIKSNRSAEDVAYEIVLKAGLPFDKNLHQKEINNNLIFVDDSKSHLFILEPTKNSKYYENIIDVVEEFAKDIAGGLNIYLNDQYFKNDEAKINFVEQVKSISEQIKVWVI